ncbi:unnamed protein product [Coffea canephora]|uniref:Cytochrome P450 n=1 Tax=Coffea canephora TaxID=49390 RepID=A0A068UF63_COFCA|nr:unnamed protein product [Coffea canephora]
MWMAIVVGIITLLGWGLWWWNYFQFALPVTFRHSGGSITTKLPSGHMGIPFFGEMLHFLWYFKVIHRPDDFINNKDTKGLYKSLLFGSPSIIACSPSANKFILQSNANFGMGWPATQIIGNNSLLFLQGSSHARIRGLVVKVINQPDALHKVAIMVQPRIVAALRLWSEKGRIVALQEAKKLLLKILGSMIKGVRREYGGGFPSNIWGHVGNSLSCRKKVMTIFTMEINKKKFEGNAARAEFDLVDQLLNLKDDDGNQLQDEEVLDNIVGLIIAGYESTSLSIMWILYYLAKHPQCTQKATEEHMNVGTNGDFIRRDDILKLHYTNKVYLHQDYTEIS